MIAGVLVIVAAVVIFFLNRPNATNLSVAGTPTPQPSPVSAAVTVPPSAVPTLMPSATSTSTGTPTPTLRPSPEPTVPPSPTPLPPSPPPTAATVPTPPPTPAASPPPALLSTAGPTPAQQPAASGAVPASPAPFVGEVSAPGGLGNTRQNLDATYGAAVGQTPQDLVVYRKNNLEYHVDLVPDLNGRAALIAVLPQQTAQLATLPQAQSQAHTLLPRDAQPNPTPEGNEQFVVERYTSESLGEALPPPTSGSVAQPAQLMIVYVKDPSGNISRWIVGTGNDPSVLLSQGG